MKPTSGLLNPSTLIAAIAVLVATYCLVVTMQGDDREDALPEQTEQESAALELQISMDEIERKIDRRLDDLEARIKGFELAQSKPQSSPLVNKSSLTGDERAQEILAHLEQRLVGMEKNLAPVIERENERNRKIEEARLKREERRKRRTASIPTHRATFEDASKPIEERLVALRRLRGAVLEDGVDARIAIVDTAVQLVQASTDAKVRADVWRHMTRVADPRLIDPLLNSLSNDKDPKVREEAAETLRTFYQNSSVKAALQAAAKNDANAKVRKEALDSLNNER